MGGLLGGLFGVQNHGTIFIWEVFLVWLEGFEIRSDDLMGLVLEGFFLSNAKRHGTLWKWCFGGLRGFKTVKELSHGSVLGWLFGNFKFGNDCRMGSF